MKILLQQMMDKYETEFNLFLCNSENTDKTDLHFEHL